MRLPKDRPGFRDLFWNRFIWIWWIFAAAPPFVGAYAIAQGYADPLGTVLMLILWIATLIALVWYLRLPRRPTSN